ncbi:hypothetical protein QFC20_002348 [Naganishia adeliensis]|uniref:Uncharacterized protein n=1 Tax=Naganishia adeliensis TaxID=92952 RepID=A0ACC2WM82_9TREE|nr:hypothetical protein QFC20_002348 [Naganishia adeliensis]
MDASPFPLSVGISVPLVFLIPTSILLYGLYGQLRHNSKGPESTQRPGDGDLRARNQNAAASKTSLASLDLRPFLKDLYLGRSDPRTVEYNVPPAMDQQEASKPDASTVARSTLFSYALGILLSLICGLVYLACATSATPSRAIGFPLAISATIIPFLVLPHSIEAIWKRTGNPLVAANEEQQRIFRRMILPLVGSVAVAALGAWISTYIVIAALAIALLSISVLALDTSRWPLPLLEPRLQQTGTVNRNTKSWFSGNGLLEADAEALARQGNMPRPGETEDAFLERMQQEGNSWITETAKASASRTHLISSFGYTAGSGRTTPVTPITPQTAYSRPISNASARTVDSSIGRKGKDRATNNNTNSWITEPTESGTTLSSFRFDCSDEIPPVPALTASTKARYGVPAAPQANVPRAIPGGEEPTFYGEGPSIIRIGDPANMTFASYDSLPIKYGKRSTNFEILDPSHILPKFRSSKSLSTMSRKHSKRTLSDESFHSAVDDPCQGLGRAGNPDQSFPRSVSMSSDDQRDVFCDALGSGRDNDSLDGDAVETVIDEDEFGYGRGKSFEARRVVSEPVTNSDSSSTALPPIAGRFMRSDALSKPSTSESEIFLPVTSTFPGRYGTQPELPQPPMDERGRYSAYSSVASPMFGAFGPGADKKSTDPLLLRGKASTRIETVDVRSADMQVFQQRRTSAGMAEKAELLGKTAVEENKLKWAFVGNLLVLWISFGLSLPVLIEVSRTQRFATALYLVSIILPGLALFATCAAVDSPLTTSFSAKGEKISRLRPLTLQPRFSDNAPTSEKPRVSKALEVYHQNLQK